MAQSHRVHSSRPLSPPPSSDWLLTVVAVNNGEDGERVKERERGKSIVHTVVKLKGGFFFNSFSSLLVGALCSRWNMKQLVMKVKLKLIHTNRPPPKKKENSSNPKQIPRHKKPNNNLHFGKKRQHENFPQNELETEKFASFEA